MDPLKEWWSNQDQHDPVREWWSPSVDAKQEEEEDDPLKKWWSRETPQPPQVTPVPAQAFSPAVAAEEVGFGPGRFLEKTVERVKKLPENWMNLVRGGWFFPPLGASKALMESVGMAGKRPGLNELMQAEATGQPLPQPGELRVPTESLQQLQGAVEGFSTLTGPASVAVGEVATEATGNPWLGLAAELAVAIPEGKILGTLAERLIAKGTSKLASKAVGAVPDVAEAAVPKVATQVAPQTATQIPSLTAEQQARIARDPALKKRLMDTAEGMFEAGGEPEEILAAQKRLIDEIIPPREAVPVVGEGFDPAVREAFLQNALQSGQFTPKQAQALFRDPRFARNIMRHLSKEGATPDDLRKVFGNLVDELEPPTKIETFAEEMQKSIDNIKETKKGPGPPPEEPPTPPEPPGGGLGPETAEELTERVTKNQPPRVPPKGRVPTEGSVEPLAPPGKRPKTIDYEASHAKYQMWRQQKIEDLRQKLDYAQSDALRSKAGSAANKKAQSDIALIKAELRKMDAPIRPPVGEGAAKPVSDAELQAALEQSPWEQMQKIPEDYYSNQEWLSTASVEDYARAAGLEPEALVKGKGKLLENKLVHRKAIEKAMAQGLPFNEDAARLYGITEKDIAAAGKRLARAEFNQGISFSKQTTYGGRRTVWAQMKGAPQLELRRNNLNGKWSVLTQDGNLIGENFNLTQAKNAARRWYREAAGQPVPKKSDLTMMVEREKLATSAAAAERKARTQYGLFEWSEGAGEYPANKALKWYKNEKAAQRAADRINAAEGKNLVVRSVVQEPMPKAQIITDMDVPEGGVIAAHAPATPAARESYATLAEVSAFGSVGRKANEYLSMLREFRALAAVSALSTHVLNVMSEGLNMLGRVLGTEAAAVFDLPMAAARKLTGRGGREIYFTEGLSELVGLFKGLDEAMFDLGNVSREAAREYLRQPVKYARDIFRSQGSIPGKAGQYLRTPLGLLGYMDTFLYNREFQAQMFKSLTRKGLKEGVSLIDIPKYVSESLSVLDNELKRLEWFVDLAKSSGDKKAINQATEALKQLFDDPLIARAKQEAARATFQEPLESRFDKVVETMSRTPGIADIALFIQTPYRVGKEFIRQTPLALTKFNAAAPLSPENAEVLGKSVLGVALMAYGAYGYRTGRIYPEVVGFSPEAATKRAAGMPTVGSVRVGDRTVPLEMFGPTGLVIGAGALAAKLMDHARERGLEPGWGSRLQAYTESIMYTMITQTPAENISEAFNALMHPEVTEDDAWSRLARQVGRSFVPNIIQRTARALGEPPKAAALAPGPAVVGGAVAAIPGTDVPVSTDIFGHPVEDPNKTIVDQIGNYLLSRGLGKTEASDPVLQELVRLSVWKRKPSGRIEIGGDARKLSKEEEYRLQNARGQAQYTLIRRVILDPRYRQLSDKEKENVVRRLIRKGSDVGSAPFRERYRFREAIR